MGCKTLFSAVFIRPEQVVHFLLCKREVVILYVFEIQRYAVIIISRFGVKDFFSGISSCDITNQIRNAPNHRRQVTQQIYLVSRQGFYKFKRIQMEINISYAIEQFLWIKVILLWILDLEQNNIVRAMFCNRTDVKFDGGSDL